MQNHTLNVDAWHRRTAASSIAHNSYRTFFKNNRFIRTPGFYRLGFPRGACFSATQMPRRELAEAIHEEIGDGSGEQGQRLRDNEAHRRLRHQAADGGRHRSRCRSRSVGYRGAAAQSAPGGITNYDLQDPELLVSIDHIQKINVSELAGRSVRIEADPKHVRGGSAVRRDVAMLGWLRPPSRALRRSAVAAFSFFVRARNLCVAHLLCMQRRNREAGSRLQRPRGVMPERLFLWESARVRV